MYIVFAQFHGIVFVGVFFLGSSTGFTIVFGFPTFSAPSSTEETYK
jgi:hypothetical protein